MDCLLFNGRISPVSLCGMRMNLMTCKEKKKKKEKSKKFELDCFLSALIFLLKDVLAFQITFILCVFCIPILMMSLSRVVTDDKCT